MQRPFTRPAELSSSDADDGSREVPLVVGALLDRYVEAAAGKACILVAAALTALFTLFEFVEQLASVGHGHYRLGDAAIYVLLTAPYRLLQVTPVSMLLGCLLGLGALGRNSELTALRSLGVSERRILTSVIRLALPIVVVLFLLAEFVIPPAQRLAQEGRSRALSSLTAVRSEDSFWAQGGGQYLNVQQFEDGNVPKDIDIYAFDGGGRLASFIHADRAEIRADGNWLLSGVLRKRIEASQFRTERLVSLSWPSFISPTQTELLILPPSSMPPVALYRYVRHLQRRHEQATRYEQEVWAKASIPFSIVAMIMIAAPFVFGPARSQNTGYQITIGAAIGVVFSLVQQIGLHLDLLLDLDPAAIALTPSLLLMALAVTLFLARHR